MRTGSDMAALEIVRTVGADGGRYEGALEGCAYRMTYRLGADRGRKIMIIDHTYVDKSLSGRGVGLALLERAIEDARAEECLIDPECSFVRQQMARKPEWSDRLAHPL
jgi:hypothetical protein